MPSRQWPGKSPSPKNGFFYISELYPFPFQPRNFVAFVRKHKTATTIESFLEEIEYFVRGINREIPKKLFKTVLLNNRLYFIQRQNIVGGPGLVGGW